MNVHGGGVLLAAVVATGVLSVQVVAAGTVDGLMRVLFCAKEATSNGTGAWFLAELLQDESALTLEATFKSKRPAVVPGFVRAFMLHHVFTMASA